MSALCRRVALLITSFVLVGGSISKASTAVAAPASHLFHGTFNPVVARDGISDDDYISFACNVGVNCRGTIHIYGAIRQVN